MAKTYLIVGGSSGIGKDLSQMLIHDGYEVYIASRNRDDLPDGSNYIELDSTKDFNSDIFPEKLDGLAYCPGSINLKPFHRLKLEDFRNDIEINYIGAVKTIQAALSALKSSELASVVMFSTVAVQTGMAFHATVAGAKGAVEGLTRSLASEYAPKIRFNCIAPSLTDTPMAERLLANDKKREALSKNHPLERVGTASDIASIAKFLLTDDSSWVTGQIFHIDGGMSNLK